MSGDGAICSTDACRSQQNYFVLCWKKCLTGESLNRVSVSEGRTNRPHDGPAPSPLAGEGWEGSTQNEGARRFPEVRSPVGVVATAPACGPSTLFWLCWKNGAAEQVTAGG
jgi:hypothetical protein